MNRSCNQQSAISNPQSTIAMDTSSFPAFLRSLNLDGSVTTKPGRMVAGPPAAWLDFALRLGLGPLLLNSPRNRAMMQKVGIGPETTAQLTQRLRSRAHWRPVLEGLAAPHLAAVDQAVERGDRRQALQEIKDALMLLNLAYGGDHYYFHTPMRDLREALPKTRRLYTLFRQITGDRGEYIRFTHAHGTSSGLLHFPPGHAAQALKSTPALVAIHGLAGDKDTFDYLTGPFREAGYATFCIDMPAHGENFDGPRLQPDDEVVGVAALETMAAHPEIDPARVGVMGASMGGFWALRTAAASSLPKVCLAFASAFDIGHELDKAVPGIQDFVAYVLGAPTLPEAYALAQPFHLRDVLGSVRCPVHLVHGTQDHICNFLVTYEIARRVKSPLSVHPLVGVDHEAANPSTLNIAGPGIEWLKENL